MMNRFFTILMGGEWHEWDTYCENKFAKGNPSYTSNPLPVLEWMRENMADTLEQALAFIWQDYEITETFTVGIFRILNLQNLAAYLIEHDECLPDRVKEYLMESK
jgi:hypothetical protein